LLSQKHVLLLSEQSENRALSQASYDMSASATKLVFEKYTYCARRECGRTWLRGVQPHDQ
jgi:hypothetical protein